MKKYQVWYYDYADKCDCSDDDRCGCVFPENMERNFSCKTVETTNQKANGQNQPSAVDKNSADKPHGNLTA